MLRRFIWLPLTALITMSLIAGGGLLAYQQMFPPNPSPPWHWRGLIPGQTTIEQVLEILGQPDRIITCDKWGAEAETTYRDGLPIQHCVLAPLIYEYEESDKGVHGTHQIHFRDNIVWLIAEDTNAYHYEDVMTNS